jgi:predicted DNA-binding protein
MKRTQIYLDEEQETRLDRRSRATGLTKSALIRAAVDAFLARERSPSDLEKALSETAGALPDLEVPARDEWDRKRA